MAFLLVCVFIVYLRRSESQQTGGCEKKDGRISDACRAHLYTLKRQHGSELHSEQGQHLSPQRCFCVYCSVCAICVRCSACCLCFVLFWLSSLSFCLCSVLFVCPCGVSVLFARWLLSFSCLCVVVLVCLFDGVVFPQGLGPQCCGVSWSEQTHTEELKHYRVLGIIDKVNNKTNL